MLFWFRHISAIFYILKETKSVNCLEMIAHGVGEQVYLSEFTTGPVPAMTENNGDSFTVIGNDVELEVEDRTINDPEKDSKSNLFCNILQKIPMKDFGAEVRASMDVVQFLNQAVLFLDIHETSLDAIIDKILQKVRDIFLILSSLLTLSGEKKKLFRKY